MLKDLRFIKGAVGKKGYVSELKHVLIKDGRATAFNGYITLSTPIDFDKTVVPVALDFLKALEKCKEQPEISITKTGRLKVQAGHFRVFINALEEQEYPTSEPEGVTTQCTMSLQAALESLRPFIGDDASRPWSAGVIIRGGYAYATNNVVLACHTTPVQFPRDAIIPKACVDELLRIKEPIQALQLTENTCTFHFEGDRWLRTNLLDGENCPDFYPILGQCNFNKEMLAEIPEDLAEHLSDLLPFVDPKNALFVFRSDGVRTSLELDEVGALCSAYGFSFSVFRPSYLMSVVENATMWNLEYYPKPCPFVGENISGVMIGVRAPNA